MQGPRYWPGDGGSEARADIRPQLTADPPVEARSPHPSAIQ